MMRLQWPQQCSYSDLNYAATVTSMMQLQWPQWCSCFDLNDAAMYTVTSMMQLHWPQWCSYSDLNNAAALTSMMQLQWPQQCSYSDLNDAATETQMMQLQWPQQCSYSDLTDAATVTSIMQLQWPQSRSYSDLNDAATVTSMMQQQWPQWCSYSDLNDAATVTSMMQQQWPQWCSYSDLNDASTVTSMMQLQWPQWCSNSDLNTTLARSEQNVQYHKPEFARNGQNHDRSQWDISPRNKSKARKVSAANRQFMIYGKINNHYNSDQGFSEWYASSDFLWALTHWGQLKPSWDVSVNLFSDGSIKSEHCARSQCFMFAMPSRQMPRGLSWEGISADGKWIMRRGPGHFLFGFSEYTVLIVMDMSRCEILKKVHSWWWSWSLYIALCTSNTTNT